jgi:alkylation response protein AidB-like acyl-CoA dehydrogenase
VHSGSADPSGEWRRKAADCASRVVAPAAERIDRDDRVPNEVLRRLAEEGFLGLGIPAEWGGSGGTARASVAVLEELSRASAAVAVLVAVHTSVCAAPIVEWGTRAQKDRYLPKLARGEYLGAFGLTEPGAGSDAAGLRTRYVRRPDGFLVNGSKMFISNAVSAGVVVLFATRDPSLGHRGISAFLVPPGTDGFSVAQRMDKLGLRGSETTELVLRDVVLPRDAMLGPEGEGLKVALQSLTGGRVGIAACALGVAQAAFDQMVRNVRADDTEWKRTALALAFSRLASARALVERAAALKEAGAEYATEASVAKLVASEAAVAIASAGVDVAGMPGTRAGAPPERLLRDARVFPVVEGTTEIQQLILARRLLGTELGRTV